MTVYRGHVFGLPLRPPAPLASHVAVERRLLEACLQCSSLLVDIPIDRQGLPYRLEAAHPWELVKRLVGFAFNALPPLADRVGTPVARCLHLVASLLQSAPDLLGQRLFEAYPAASLSLLDGASGTVVQVNVAQTGRQSSTSGDAPTLLFGSSPVVTTALLLSKHEHKWRCLLRSHNRHVPRAVDCSC